MTSKSRVHSKVAAKLEDTARRGENWNTEATNLLIELWQEHVIQLRGQRKTLSVYKKIQKRMFDRGVRKNVTEIKHRIYNLNQRYRKEKSMEGNGVSNWTHFHAIDEFLGESPSNIRHSQEKVDYTRFIKYEYAESPGVDRAVSESEDSTCQSKDPKRRLCTCEGENEILKGIAETQKMLVKIMAQSQRAQEEFQAQFLAFQRDFIDIMRTCTQMDK